MKPAMVLSDEDVQRVRESLVKTLTPRHKVVIAPCLAEVFVLNKSKSILRRSFKEKWNTVGKGVIALVYNTDSLGQRIEICLTSVKTRAVVWRETPRHKVVIAPCLAEVFVLNKSKSILRRSFKEKWNTVGKGVIALVYNTDSLGQRIEICLTSVKTRAVVWRETVVAYLTRIESPQPSYHTFNSTRNFYEKTAIRYENETVASLVLRALNVFSSPSKSQRDARGPGGHKPASRSHSFNVAPRPRHPRAQENAFERCTVALSNIQIQQVFSSEGRPASEPQKGLLCKTTSALTTPHAQSQQSERLVSISEACEKSSSDQTTFYHPNKQILSYKQPSRSHSFNLVRRCTEPVINTTDLMVTDLCTTEL